MVALIRDARRLRRGVSPAFLPLLIALSLYAFIACATSTGTGGNASPDTNPIPASDPEQSEASDHHLYPENGEHRDGRAELGDIQPIMDVSGLDGPPVPVGIADAPAVDSPEFPLAPDGIRYGLLSPACHGSPDPECGPTKMYVGENLALAVYSENVGWSLHFSYNEDFSCPSSSDRIYDDNPPGLDKYRDMVEKRGKLFEFASFYACAQGKATILLNRIDGKTAQHHIEIFNLPAGMERHPNVPAPLPTISPEQAEKARLLKERFDTVTAKLQAPTFNSAVLGVAVACPAYATSKDFEILEGLTERHQRAGLLHLMDSRKQGTSYSEIWGMIEDDPARVEVYVEILEWGYDEYSAMIKKPQSLFGCD